MKKIPHNIKTYIESEFYNYEYYKAELAAIRDSLFAAPPPPDGLPRGNKLVNPVEKKVLNMMSNTTVLSLERTINAIEWSLSVLSDEHRHIFNEIYIKGRHENSVATDFPTSYETINRRKNEIMYEFGCKFGLIKKLTEY